MRCRHDEVAGLPRLILMLLLLLLPGFFVLLVRVSY